MKTPELSPPLEVTPEMKAHVAMVAEVRDRVVQGLMDGAPVQDDNAALVEACRYIGRHWVGAVGRLAMKAADRIEQLESLVRANDEERLLAKQLKDSAQMSEDSFRDLFSRWRTSVAEYERLRKLIHIAAKEST